MAGVPHTMYLAAAWCHEYTVTCHCSVERQQGFTGSLRSVFVRVRVRACRVAGWCCVCICLPFHLPPCRSLAPVIFPGSSLTWGQPWDCLCRHCRHTHLGTLPQGAWSLTFATCIAATGRPDPLEETVHLQYAGFTLR